MWKNRQLFFGYAENRLLLLSRSITGLLGILCGVYIIDHLVLSDVDMIGKLTSFILIILSAIFLKESISPAMDFMPYCLYRGTFYYQTGS